MNDDAILTSTEAREEFGWSRDMMTKLLRSGQIPFTTDPLDKRLKWVRREDVARLAAASRKRQRLRPPRDAASGRADASSAPNATVPAPVAVASFLTSAVTPAPPAKLGKPDALTLRTRGSGRLKPSDQVVLAYLRALCAVTSTDMTPPVGYEIIAQRCGICPRQAQICCDRLVAARRLERLGYDAGHPDLTRRGMVYRVPDAGHDSH